MAAANNNREERCFGVTNIKHHIPVILDIEDYNYDAWRELLLTHCMTFDVARHPDDTLLPTCANDDAWRKRDGLVKLWLYDTMAQPLFRSDFKTGGSARDIWLRVENQFRNNKEARAIQLDNQLRTMEIGDQSIHDYCQKMKTTTDLLSNVDAPVNERTLVMYLINEKYDNFINVIKHKEPFPSFGSAKSMLQWGKDALTAYATPQPGPSQNNQNRNRFWNNKGNHSGGRRSGRGNYSPNPYRNNWSKPPFWPTPPPPYWMQPYLAWPQPAPTPSAPPQQPNLIEFLQPPQSYTTETLAEPSSDWYMDSGASAHLAENTGSPKSESSTPM